MDKNNVTTEQDRQADKWEWPEVSNADDEFKGSNALGYPPDWYQPDQPEIIEEPEEEVKPLTLEELEAIRQNAYEDGFAEGKEQGFTAGFEEGKQQGHAQGYEEGLQTGTQDGLAQGQQFIEERTEQWQQLLDRLAHPLHEMDQNVEQQLVWMSMQLAKAIIKTEPHIAPDILMNAFQEAVKLLPAAQNGITVELNPDDLTIIQEVYSAEECEKRGWTLNLNPVMERGNLTLISETSSIDLFLEQRIEQLLRQFLRQNLDRQS